MEMQKIFSIQNIDHIKNIFVFGKQFKIHSNKRVQLSEKDIVFGAWKTENSAMCICNYCRTLSKVEAAWARLDPTIWLIFVSCLLEVNREDEASYILKKYIKRFGLVRIHNFLPVANFAKQLNYPNDLILKAASMFKALDFGRRNQLFENYCKSKSVAVVGNGPQQLGKGTGIEIDSHDVVIRFNRYGINLSDYGNKCSICAKNLEILNGDDVHISDGDLQLFKLDIWHSEVATDTIIQKSQHFISSKCDYIPVSVNRILEEYSDYDMTNPTLGYIVLLWLFNMRKSLLKLDVYGFGFLDRDKYRGTSFYYANKSNHVDIKDQKVHKHKRECEILQNIFLE